MDDWNSNSQFGQDHNWEAPDYSFQLHTDNIIPNNTNSLLENSKQNSCDLLNTTAINSTLPTNHTINNNNSNQNQAISFVKPSHLLTGHIPNNHKKTQFIFFFFFLSVLVHKKYPPKIYCFFCLFFLCFLFCFVNKQKERPKKNRTQTLKRKTKNLKK